MKFKYCCIFCRADMQVCGRYTSMRGCKAKVVWYGLSVGICLISRYTLGWPESYTHTAYDRMYGGIFLLKIPYIFTVYIYTCMVLANPRYTLWWARRLWKHTGTGRPTTSVNVSTISMVPLKHVSMHVCTCVCECVCVCFCACVRLCVMNRKGKANVCRTVAQVQKR